MARRVAAAGDERGAARDDVRRGPRVRGNAFRRRAASRCAGGRAAAMIPRHGRASLIIAAGFLLRAFAGQALFWISYLRLPIARPLQLGDGLWFFAVDGAFYVQYA